MGKSNIDRLRKSRIAKAKAIQKATTDKKVADVAADKKESSADKKEDKGDSKKTFKDVFGTF
jgi:hypothetical protein